MRILYYSWEETNAADAIECLQYNGNEVDCFSYPIVDKLNDVPFAKKLEETLKEKNMIVFLHLTFFRLFQK